MLTELYKPSILTKPQLFPPAADRAAWDTLPEGCKARWLAAGRAAQEQPVPALPLSLWLKFIQAGDRAQYEHAYFARRRQICALAMAECVAGSGEFLPALADALWAVCEESAWQLPAHNTYVRDTPQLPLPDVRRPIIDLFAAETGELLATVHALLADRLDAFAPGLADRLVQEVTARVLTPYRQTHFWWMGNGEEPMCNWTPWCTQNVLLAAVQLLPAPELAPYIKQASHSLDCFLKDYGPDGCCSEGAQYYRHAALTLWGALELMCRAAPGVFDSVWAEPKIKNMAEYIVKMHVGGPYYFNFADCSPLAGARGVREYLFARRVGSAPLAALAAQDRAAALQAPDPDRLRHPDDSEGINLAYHLLAAFAERDVTACAAAHPEPPAAGDAWYASTGLLVLRRGCYALGAKAGCNADSHNHNDVGSVTLYKNGAPVLIDIGVETYSKKTFSPQRYEIWTMQSSWHNLPEFDPDGAQYRQQPGADFAARDVRADAEAGRMEMDIAPAYGAVAGLGYYRRTVSLTENGLTLCDETDYPGTAALTLMSAQPPHVQGDTVCFGSLARASVQGAERLVTEAVPVADPRLRQAWPDIIYRTRLYFSKRFNMELH